MKFGWINLCGAVVVVLMLAPNVVYAIRHKDEKNLCENKWMNALEQVGRYASIVLMWLPLLVWEFGFSGETGMLLYFAGNVILLAAYWAVFAVYMKKKTTGSALALAVLPTCVFLLSGLTLRHWLLVLSAVLFGIGHIYVTLKNAQLGEKTDGDRTV